MNESTVILSKNLLTVEKQEGLTTPPLLIKPHPNRMLQTVYVQEDFTTLWSKQPENEMIAALGLSETWQILLDLSPHVTN